MSRSIHISGILHTHTNSDYFMVEFPNVCYSRHLASGDHVGPTRRSDPVTRATTKGSDKGLTPEAMTLAAMLAALDRPGNLSATRLRDLRSAVKRVANLLGDEPAGLPLDIAG